MTVVTFSGALFECGRGCRRRRSFDDYMPFAEVCTIQFVTSQVHKSDTVWVRIVSVTIRH